jgi:hypothetical protein
MGNIKITKKKQFEQFPKIRPPLPEKIKKIYSAHYKENREGNSLSSSISKRMESWLHKKVAEDVIDKSDKKMTLEIGAGTLNQLLYEPIYIYDIVEPFKELYSDSPHKDKIRRIFSDISEVSMEKKYDRIISVATFEHICNLPVVVATSGKLLSESGNVRVSIPNEGSWLWRLGWTITTGVEFFLKYRINYSILMKHEHVNTASEIEECLKYFFEKVEISYFGLSKQLSLYHFYSCSTPRIGKCDEFLRID